MAYLVIVAASNGRRAAIFVTFGVALGLLIIGILAALGLAALAVKTPWIFETLRWAGVLYLLFLAWETWRVKAVTEGMAMIAQQSDRQFFRRGLIINLLNPKAAFFFISILPTFVHSPISKTSALLTLTALYVIIATVVHLLLVFFASQIHNWFDNQSHEKMLRGGFSILLLMVAGWFAIA